jgi:PPK2 family polyphosphate:nucleotide phosphotransferase
MASMRSRLALPPGPVNLADLDPAARPGAPKKDPLKTHGKQLSALQERLWAESTAGGHRSVLLVLQGMDTAGKGGVTEHVVGACGPIGVQYTAFKKPTSQELAHNFLWRIRQRVPGPGMIGVFDRSHYEDVLVVRVHELVPETEVDRRYAQINRFESTLVAKGTTVVKVFLHLSYETQRERLLARLADPDKHWKFHESDIDERQLWDRYVEAYELALERCNTELAPWYVVPADDKAYRNWAVARLLHETLDDLDPQYPRPEFDVKVLRKRLKGKA